MTVQPLLWRRIAHAVQHPELGDRGRKVRRRSLAAELLVRVGVRWDHRAADRHLSATPSFMLATLCCGSVTRTIVPPPLGPEVGERAAGRSTFV